MSARPAALIVGALDAAVWALVAVASILSGSDAATRGLDHAAGVAVTALFAVTGLPALILAWQGLRPGLALWLALVFPAAFAAAFAAMVVSLA